MSIRHWLPAIAITALPLAPAAARADDVFDDKLLKGRNERTALFFSWAPSLAVGPTNRWVDAPTGRALDFQFRYFFAKGFSVGGGFNWTAFVEQNPRSTYQLDNGAITATVYPRFETVAFTAITHWHPFSMGPLMPFVGFGIGPASYQYRLAVADVAFSLQNWTVAFAPELGATFDWKLPNGQSLGFHVTFRYTAMGAKLEQQGIDNAQTLSLVTGITYLP